MPLTFACRTFGHSSYGTNPLAVPLLTVDHQLGPVVTFHIEGSAVGATNRLSTQSIEGGDWSEQAMLAGDGDLAVTIPAGGHFVRVVSELAGQSAVTNLVFVQVAAEATSTLTRCLNAIRSRIVLLGLSGLAPEQVVVAKGPTERGINRPVVVISPATEGVLAQGTNIRDDVVYRVRVTILADSLPPALETANLWLHWRERIRAALASQRLPGVPSVHSVRVTETESLLAEAWLQRNAFATSLQIELIARENRGA